MKQAIGIQLILFLEIKLQNTNFSEKYHIISAGDASILCPYYDENVLLAYPTI